MKKIIVHKILVQKLMKRSLMREGLGGGEIILKWIFERKVLMVRTELN